MALFSKDAQAAIAGKPNDAARRAPHLLGIPPTDAAKPSPRHGAASASKQSRGESRLIVGPNIKLKGVEIEDCDTLVVEGYVEASMNSRVIEISPDGVYKGTVEIDIAIVRGRFEGNLTARDRLVVHNGGSVSGKIRYGRLAIEEGGRVHGDLDEIGSPKAASEIKSATGGADGG